jgi:metal-dependent amidase/aminoacylase/carboxypeptidase family protein
MKKTFASLLVVATLGLASAHAAAQQTGRLVVEFQGPGGHSNGAYGRTSAVHAAGRSLMQLKKAGIDRAAFKVVGLNGGNSVNSIASDAGYEVRLTAADATAYQSLVTRVTDAVKAGVAAENEFRAVKEGDLTSGVPANVRYTITAKAQ